MLLSWNVYEIRSDNDALHGVKLRGRVRKFAIERGLTCLVENASDEENVVRLALLCGSSPDSITEFVEALVPGTKMIEIMREVPNPVLSKLNVNDVSRYSLD